MSRIILIAILPFLALTSCLKDLDGPNSLAPQDPKRYGTLMIHTDWAEFKQLCPSFNVTLDGEFIGQIKDFVSSPDCYEFEALTVDSVLEGEHVIFAGKCDSVSWEVIRVILPDQCNRVKLSR